ncbi:hypothetical protein N177_1490 [Lutibaculum baratangense AMV1]|uniref:Peptidase metallopeptidase domain-containing protein n=1 Tax=Lutibaculum baratangense AMV1 TaxID=631454 RepID=V4R0X2_9HYPH|nr:M10 family metallopeptidase C-terminal domain-containing protein [Lutibaculum baratangense]ESR25657.1 hypothetical protein N177_1490 [Lutibaculum baratangense AMV1]
MGIWQGGFEEWLGDGATGESEGADLEDLKNRFADGGSDLDRWAGLTALTGGLHSRFWHPDEPAAAGDTLLEVLAKYRDLLASQTASAEEAFDWERPQLLADDFRDLLQSSTGTLDDDGLLRVWTGFRSLLDEIEDLVVGDRPANDPLAQGWQTFTNLLDAIEDLFESARSPDAAGSAGPLTDTASTSSEADDDATTGIFDPAAGLLAISDPKAAELGPYDAPIGSLDAAPISKSGPNEGTGITSSPTVAIGLDGYTNGDISFAGERDSFSITLEAGKTYSIYLFGNSAGNTNSLADTVLRVYDDAALTNQIAFNDDGAKGSGQGFYYLNSYLDFSPSTTGTYYLEAADFGDDGTGQYSIIVEDMTVNQPTDAVDWGVNVYDPNIRVYFANAGETYDGTTSLGWDPYMIDASMHGLETMASYTAELTVTRTLNPADANLFLVTYNASDGSSGSFGPSGTLGANVGKWNLQSSSFLAPGLYTNNWDPGNGAYHTLIHEFGHALGLAHAHDIGGISPVMNGVTSSTGDYGDFDFNHGAFTIMGYNYRGDTNGSAPGGTAPSLLDRYGFALGPSTLDVANLQARYGASTTMNSGDSTFTIVDANVDGTGFRTIHDVGGNDTFQYTGNKNATIDLRAATLLYEEGGAGYVSFVEGVFGGLTIAHGTVIENAVGGSGNDRITGNAADNVLTGNAGNDTIAGGADNDTLIGGAGADVLGGGAGVDTANYASSGAAVQVSLQNGTGSGGDAEGDTLYSIENLVGSSFGDILVGHGGANALYGLAGNDTLIGGAGADILAGGGGVDTANYASSGAAVQVSLEAGTATGGHAAGDVLYSIENLVGSNFGDRLTGDAGGNLLFGLGGNDTLIGGAATTRSSAAPEPMSSAAARGSTRRTTPRPARPSRFRCTQARGPAATPPAIRSTPSRTSWPRISETSWPATAPRTRSTAAAATTP